MSTHMHKNCLQWDLRQHHLAHRHTFSLSNSLLT